MSTMLSNFGRSLFHAHLLIKMSCATGLVAIIHWQVLATCDGLGASGSVGACYTPTPKDKQCGIAAGEAACASVSGDAIYILEDFPTSCTTKVDHNCNEINKNCWWYTDCVWQDGVCIPDPNQGPPPAGGAPGQAKKRTSEKCPDT
jgi:hypothetical protein